MSPEELGPLPPGRHGYSREQVAHHQRERLIAAMATVVVEKGYAAVTLADIVKEAKVSRRVFYANFESKERCFFAAFKVLAGHLRELIDEALDGVEEWPQQVVVIGRTLLGFLAADPGIARLCLVESRAAGPSVTARFNQAVRALSPLMERGRAERDPAARPLPASTEDVTIGAVVSLTYRKVAAGEADRLGDLLPECIELVLMPYLGVAEAARIAREAA